MENGGTAPPRQRLQGATGLYLYSPYTLMIQGVSLFYLCYQRTCLYVRLNAPVQGIEP